MTTLTGIRVALLATDGFEHAELFDPLAALAAADASVHVVSLGGGTIQGYREFEPAGSVAVDRRVADVGTDDYDALLLPGGTINADKLRTDADVRRLVGGFVDGGKPVAALCHAPWLLIDAGVAGGRRLTSYHAIRCDLENAGAEWVDEAGVISDNVLTSRDPGDLPVFVERMLQLFGTVRS